MEFITKLKLEDKVVVTDPCYCTDLEESGIILLKEVQEGEYKCYAIYDRDNQIKEAVILFENLSFWNKDAYSWQLETKTISVDAGIAGVINYALYEEMMLCKAKNEKEWESRYYKEICELFSKDDTICFRENSFITLTGVGDGEYEVFTTKNKDNKIVGINIVYIEDEDEEDDEWYDEEFEDDWEEEEEY
ncbi:DUF4241 domain-containing protein [uncultured Fusobacterium sp.]|uniref:DUF4241 domain-containing protein n=1 Tax=uncultured Fusobacterium sp. TaxID=159267 RepID=UPI0025FEF4EC|nr:DUF4241 domain-containing protein [uncultured Fusobacterium sp.]